jgi:hypothetical protein
MAWQSEMMFFRPGQALRSNTDTTPSLSNRVSCPPDHILVFHAIDYVYAYGTDWNNHQHKNYFVQPDYATNSITCRVHMVDQPAVVGGLGLCMRVSSPVVY